jgi:rhodanese-related sulfurtransferase
MEWPEIGQGRVKIVAGGRAGLHHPWKFARTIKMAQKITLGSRALVDAAEREVETVSVEEARKLHGRADITFIDIRDIRELKRDGRVPGAFHCPRGMLEFWIDPESKYFKPIFGEDKKFVFFCAGGLRSALAAQTAQRMGLKPVAHIREGFGGWKAAGGPVETDGK